MWTAWTEADDRGPVLHAGELTMGVRVSDGIETSVGPKAVSAAFTVSAGESVVVAVVAAHDGPLYLPDVASIDARLD